MKRRYKVMLIAMAGVLFVPAQAQARSIQATSQIITITAAVDSRITVVVDGTGTITTIFSNSDTLVAPRYVANTLSGPEVTVSEATMALYTQLMRDRTVTYGPIYQRTAELPQILQLNTVSPLYNPMSLWPDSSAQK